MGGADTVNVLLVDDVPANLIALEALLADPGYRIFTAASARQALALLVEHDFAVLLLDVMMPEMDGYQLAAAIKSRELTRYVPILFVTAQATESRYRRRGYEVGGVDYLPKPLDPSAVRAKVAAFAELHRKSRRVEAAETELRRVNEDLVKRMEERNAALFEQTNVLDSMTEGVNVVDDDLIITYTNPALDRMLGYEAGELVGNHASILSAQSREDAEARLRGGLAALRTQGKWITESLIYRKDGTPVLTRVRISAGGTVRGRGVVVVREDITEERRADDARRKTEQQLRLISDALPVLISYIDREHRYQFTNLAYEKWFGPEGRRAHGKPMAEVIGDAAYTAALPYLERAMEGETVRYEARMKYRNGVRDIDVTYIPAKDPNTDSVMGLVALVHDVTERKGTESSLRETEERLRLASEAAHFGYWDWWLESGRLIWTEQTYEMFQIPVNTPITFPGLLAHVHPDDHAAIETALEKARSHAASPDFSIEFRVQLPDGGERWLYSRGTVVFEETGGTSRPIRAIGTVVDISQRRRMEDELKRSNEELARFAYVASHDLQEPLRVIAGYVGLLQRRLQGSDPEIDTYVDHAVQGARRMKQLIDDLLLYSKAGSRPRRAEAVSLGPLVTGVLENLQASVSECGAEITVKALPTVYGDPSQLAQVFQNLLANAIKYRRRGSPRIEVNCDRRGPEWLFCVKDDGIGFDMREGQRIFELFHRLHTKTDYQGTGIGLAICKRVVESHGGRIWAESLPDRGAAFYFTIPNGNGKDR